MATLDDAVKVQAIKGALKSALLKGRSSASVYENLIGTKIGIREQEFYRIAKDVKVDVAKIQALWELPRSSVITPEYALRAAARAEIIYSFKAHVEVWSPDGQSLGDRYITATSESYKTKDEVIKQIESSQGSWEQQDVKYGVYDIVEAYYHGI